MRAVVSFVRNRAREVDEERKTPLTGCGTPVAYCVRTVNVTSGQQFFDIAEA